MTQRPWCGRETSGRVPDLAWGCEKAWEGEQVEVGPIPITDTQQKPAREAVGHGR